MRNNPPNTNYLDWISNPPLSTRKRKNRMKSTKAASSPKENSSSISTLMTIKKSTFVSKSDKNSAREMLRDKRHKRHKGKRRCRRTGRLRICAPLHPKYGLQPKVEPPDAPLKLTACELELISTPVPVGLKTTRSLRRMYR